MTVYYHSMQYSIEVFVEQWNKPFKIISQYLSDTLRRMLKKSQSPIITFFFFFFKSNLRGSDKKCVFNSTSSYAAKKLN